MGSFFQVDLDALKGFVDSLRQSDENMTSALDALKSAGDSTHIGTDDLNDAANHFQSTWHYGMTQIHSMTKETGDGVNGVYSNYQQTEQAVSDALGKISSALAGGE
jgi:hypothetical protein